MTSAANTWEGGGTAASDLGASGGRTRPGPMNDAVAEDDVAFLGEGLDGGHTGEVARDGDVTGVLANKGGEFFFQALVVGTAAIGKTPWSDWRLG